MYSKYRQSKDISTSQQYVWTQTFKILTNLFSEVFDNICIMEKYDLIDVGTINWLGYN